MLLGNSIATSLIAHSHKGLEISSLIEKNSVIPGTERCVFGTFFHVRFQTLLPRPLETYLTSYFIRSCANSSFVTDE
jgi:hypothetical protein